MGRKYKFVGVKFWGSGERKLSEFKKQFARQIAPDEMKSAFDYVKNEYKRLN